MPQLDTPPHHAKTGVIPAAVASHFTAPIAAAAYTSHSGGICKQLGSCHSPLATSRILATSAAGATGCL